MKKYFFTVVMSALGLTVSAQGEYDALRYSQGDLLGTARYMGMAGAFGALGGDMSAISQNPGGIGIYRSSEFSFTPVVSYTTSASDFNGVEQSDNKLSAGFNSIGYVGAFRPNNDENINNINFGVSFTKTKDFSKNMLVSGKNRTTSLLDPICRNFENELPGDLYDLGLLAYDSYLIDYDNGTYKDVLRAGELVDNTMFLNESGYSGVFDFTLGANWGHFMYMGVGLGVNVMDYSMTSSYYERSQGVTEGDQVWDPIEYELRNALNTTGSGVNFKIGAILKPFPFLRFGFALHSPTYYSLTDVYGSSMSSSFLPGNSIAEIGEAEGSYELQTPGKIMYSAAYLFGSRAMLSFDCDVVDYREMALKTDNGMPMSDRNLAIDNHFKTAYNLRLGGEYRVTDNVSLRAGFARYGTAYNNGHAAANTPVKAVGTTPYYAFDKETLYMTGGLGYRSGAFFLDATATVRNAGEEFFAFYDETFPNETRTDKRYADVKVKRLNMVVTAGFRF